MDIEKSDVYSVEDEISKLSERYCVEKCIDIEASSEIIRKEVSELNARDLVDCEPDNQSSISSSGSERVLIEEKRTYFNGFLVVERSFLTADEVKLRPMDDLPYAESLDKYKKMESSGGRCSLGILIFAGFLITMTVAATLLILAGLRFDWD